MDLDNYKERDLIIFGKEINWSKPSFERISLDENNQPIMHGLIGGGIAHYENLTVEKLEQLATKDFIRLDESQNNSPTVAKFLEFMRQFPQVTAIGYAVDPSRDDYRVSITGLSCKKDITELLKKSFTQFCESADEKVITEKMLHAWWD